MKQLVDPENMEKKKALLFEAFLAREQQWADFSFPEELRETNGTPGEVGE